MSEVVDDAAQVAAARVFADLVIEAVDQHHFRSPTPGEPMVDYVSALVAYVDARDFAMAHEIRLGKRQADWTPEEARHFGDVILATKKRASETFAPGVHQFVVADDPGPYPVTDAELLAIAARGLKGFRKRRTKRPTETLPIMASALLTTGHLLHTTVSREERVAVLKWFAQTQPMVGYVLVFDGFIHGIDDTRGTATKTDAFFAHVGSRTLRVIKLHPYRVVAGKVQWAAPRPDLDMRDSAMTFEDPYAGIFVSVPPATGEPS